METGLCEVLNPHGLTLIDFSENNKAAGIQKPPFDVAERGLLRKLRRFTPGCYVNARGAGQGVCAF